MTQVTDRQRTILAGAEIDGCTLVIPEKLSRPDYVAMNKLLMALGGVWDRRKKGHVFASDPTEAVTRVLFTGEIPKAPNERRDHGYVATPPDLADWLVREHTDIGDLDEGMVLEPSAGDGNLVRAIAAANRDLDVIAVEPNERWSVSIDRDQAAVFTGRFEDFLHALMPNGIPWAREFHGIVMNPPFSVPGRPTIWIDHLWHAWRLLRPGGRLTSIVPAGFSFREDRRHREVREWHQRYSGFQQELDPSWFGGVHTRLLAVEKPEEWTPEDDRPPKRGRGKPTPEEQAQRRAEDQQLRLAADEGLADEEFVEDMERRMGRLPADCRLASYSPRNQALVLTQCDAMGVRVTGHLNTFKGWLDEGRMVRAGQRAIRIIAAMGDEDAKPEDQEQEQRKRFRVTTRFELSQTKGADDEE